MTILNWKSSGFVIRLGKGLEYIIHYKPKCIIKARAHDVYVVYKLDSHPKWAVQGC